MNPKAQHPDAQPLTVARAIFLMKLHQPFIITGRLMAGLEINKAFISMSAGPRDAEGRTQYQCYIDLPDGSEHVVADLRSGCQGGTLQEGFVSLLSFLGAAAESYRQHGCDWKRIDSLHNASMFPRAVSAWAYECSDELSMLGLEIEETPNLIES